MSCGVESEAFSMLQPDLLTKNELIQKIQSRCCRIENLGLMAKEGLVGLFRRVILPLPQRFYRTNRRGKMLTSRRAKAGLETKKKEEGLSNDRPSSRVSTSADRLKPPPDASKSYRIRIGSQEKEKSTSDLNEVEIKQRRISNEGHTPVEPPSGRKITLKRPSRDEEMSVRTTSPTESKKKRTAIKWP